MATTPSPRVLHVTQVYAGGISRAIKSLVELTPEVEHHLLWAGNEQPDPTLPFKTVHELPQSPREMVTAVQRVKSVVAEVRPDYVHAHSSFGGVYARLARLAEPVFYEPHCYKFDDRQQLAPMRVIYRLVEQALAPRAARTVVLSPHEEALARSLHTRGEVLFLPNVATVLPTEAHPASRFEHGRDVFMIGRLTGQKDPAYFADVAHRVRKQASDVTFRWIGDVDGVDDGRGARMRTRLENAGVRVLGWLDGDALATELSRPGLYFHSAHYEGFPLSILDAAAFEHPIAVRRIPTFEGMNLPSAASAHDAAELILRILDGKDEYVSAREGAQRLNATMNKTAQRSALHALYAPVS
ncbi:glycosyltransferase [Microbacterium oryzae]|uniref:glycosyltransferase n=1 Tax=Microbacterium oryzae TaxID=743009 RepID=UPI0025B19491|nr:glycosyltransferase [Microbacterium oryzae]